MVRTKAAVAVAEAKVAPKSIAMKPSAAAGSAFTKSTSRSSNLSRGASSSSNLGEAYDKEAHIKELEVLMHEAADSLDFVEAQRLKDELGKIRAGEGAGVAVAVAAKKVARKAASKVISKAAGKAAAKVAKKAASKAASKAVAKAKAKAKAVSEAAAGKAAGKATAKAKAASKAGKRKKGGEDEEDEAEGSDDEGALEAVATSGGEEDEEDERPKRGKKRGGEAVEKVAKLRAPAKPAVKELLLDPFFDNSHPDLLKPDCPTTVDRETYRAVQVGNIAFLKDKLLGHVPLLLMRDVASRTTALHAAIEANNTMAIATLAKEVMLGRAASIQSKRRSGLQATGTGEMSVMTLGFATGKIGVARGGREMNNALADPADQPEYITAVLARKEISRENFQLLTGLGLLSPGGGGRHEFYKGSLEKSLEMILAGGQRSTARYVLERMTGYPGISKAHLEALSDAAISEDVTARQVTAQLGFGGQFTPVHLAAINENSAKLETFLKMVPGAATLASPNGYMPIHLAAACASADPLKLLLTEWSVDKQTLGPGKRTPLHFAAAAGRGDNVRAIMGGRGTGPGTPPKELIKEVRDLYARMSAYAAAEEKMAKVGPEGLTVLSQLLLEFVFLWVKEAESCGVGGNISGPSLRRAAAKLLTGVLTPRGPKKAVPKAAAKAKAKASAKGAALLKKLSEISEEALETMFQAIDSNGDGKLDKQEVSEIFKSKGIAISKKMMAKVMQDMDPDGSSEVSLDEFSAWMSSKSNQAKALRTALAVESGEMSAADVATAEETEEAEAEALPPDAEAQLNMRWMLSLPGISEKAMEIFEKELDFVAQQVEKVAMKALVVASNAALGAKKSTIAGEHVVRGIKAHTDLQRLYKADSVVINCLMLPAKDKTGYMPIHLAAENGHLEALRALVDCGADVNAAGPDRKCALGYAAERGHTNCVRLLLECKAKVDNRDKRRRTPLLLCVRAGRAVEASILLNASADPNAADDSGNTVTHYAAAFGWLECIELLSQAGAGMSTANAMKLAPVTAALQKGHVSVFRRLLSLGIDPNFRDADGSTLLINSLVSATRYVHHEVAFLLDQKADATLASSHGKSPLHALASISIAGGNIPVYVARAAEETRLEKLKGWPERPQRPPAVQFDEDIDDVGFSFSRPVGGRKKKMSRFERRAQMMQHQKEMEQRKVEQQKLAAMQRREVEELLKAQGDEEEAQLAKPARERGFHQLTVAEREAVFRLGWTEQEWQKGYNPTVAWEALTEERKAAAVLLGLGEERWQVLPVKALLDCRSFADGSFALHDAFALAASEDGFVTVKFPNGSLGTHHISLLLLPEDNIARKEDTTTRDLIQHVTVAMAQLLIDNGANVNAVDSKGETPLMNAASSGHTDLAMYLIERGADVKVWSMPPDPMEVVTKPGAPKALLPAKSTALHFVQGASFRNGQTSMAMLVRTMVQKGVPLERVPADETGRAIAPAPLHRFISICAVDAAKVLLEAKADPTAQAESGNALHEAFAKIFVAYHPGWNQSMKELALELLQSPESGSLLAAECSNALPHEAPVRTLVKSLGAMWSQGTDVSLRPARATALLEIFNAIPQDINLAQWADFARIKAYCEKNKCTVPGFGSGEGRSPLTLLCQLDFMACPKLGQDAVKFLLSRGLDANGDGDGEPAVLHELCARSSGNLTNSPLAEVLIAATDLNRPMVNGGMLLPYLASFNADAGVEATIVRLLKANADPNGLHSSEQRTALHFVAPRRQESLLAHLLEAGAKADVVDTRQMTPLHLVVLKAPTGSTASFDIEEMLLQAAADPAAVDAAGRTPLHYAFLKEDDAYKSTSPWFTEIEELRDGAKVKILQWNTAYNYIKARVDPIQTVDGLCAALSSRSDVLNIQDKEGFSALHLAALRGAVISASKLLMAKADAEIQVRGNTALGLAMHRHPETAVSLMQRGVSTMGPCTIFKTAGAQNSANRRGGFSNFGFNGFGQPMQQQQQDVEVDCAAAESPFSLAVRKAGASQESASDSAAAYLGAAITALDCGFPIGQAFRDAIASKQYIMLLVLLPKAGNEVLRTQRFQKNRNILHLMADSPCEAGQQQVAFMRLARKLLERGVPVDEDEDGRTALHLAAVNQCVELVELLLAFQGAALATTLVNRKDKVGCSALGLTVHHAKTEKVSLDIARTLIRYKASPADAIADGVQGETLLMSCIKHGWPALARPTGMEPLWPDVLFREVAPAVEVQDKKGRSCLSFAAMAPAHAAEYIRCILEWCQRGSAGAVAGRHALLSLDEAGCTPLRLAVDQRNVCFIEHLLSALASGAKDLLKEVVTQQAPDGMTALMAAAAKVEDRGQCVSLILRWCDGDTVAALLSATDSHGHTALAHAVLANNMPAVQCLLSGRPVAPQPTKVVCPQGIMAGDKVRVRAQLTGCSEDGESTWSVTWSHPPKNGTFKTHVLPAQVVKQNDGSNLLVDASGIIYEVDYTLPPGTGPGVEFQVDWRVAAMGHGSSALAGAFLAEGLPPRAPDSLMLQDKRGRSLLHLCLCPLPFGSFENDEMLRALIQAGVPADVRDEKGVTAAVLAAAQASGTMAAAMKAEGLHVPEGDTMDTSEAHDDAAWPEAVDLEADSAAALAASSLAGEEGEDGPRPVPVDKHFSAPSRSSRTLVALGPDNLALDLVMTKVDVSKGPYGQNLFYRMQVVHELNQDNFFLFTRWGRIGTSGQFQSSPFESLEKATSEFMKIFKSKTGNDWLSRDSFEKKPLKYQLHTIDYATDKAPADVLQFKKWKPLPVSQTPLSLLPLLQAVSRPKLLSGTLTQQKVKQPLGQLVRKHLDEARDLLEKIRILIARVKQERAASPPDGDRLQQLSEEIAEASSRIYELLPTADFSHTEMTPIENSRMLLQWSQKIADTDDMAAAARLLLGCQAKISTMSPIDYIYRALGARFRRLQCSGADAESAEVELIEQLITRSTPSACYLYAGPRARKLPVRSPGGKRQWRLLSDARCYATADCKGKAVALALAGGTVHEYKFDPDSGAVCIREDVAQSSRSDAHQGTLWIMPKASGRVVATRLTDREEASSIAAIYKVDLPSEMDRPSGPGSKLLFHGSGAQNTLSILSQGLRVKPPSALHHGSAFGDGLYFGNSFAKSRPYSSLTDGVGFMLLCQVDVGRSLESSSGFESACNEARRQVAIKKLGLNPRNNGGALLSEEEQRKLDEELKRMAQEHPEFNLNGLPYDSFHFKSGGHPDPVGDVIHPEGYLVPAGPIVGGAAMDEIIVYDRNRVRIRYLIELRDPTVSIAPPPEEDEEADALMD